MIRRTLVVGLSLCALGCAGEPMPAAATLTLGSLDAAGAFHPLADGEEATLVEGAQGGFHVWMAWRSTGLPAGEARMDRTAHRVSDGALTLRTSGAVEVPAPDASGGAGSDQPLPMFMCPSPIGVSVIDVPISFELAVTTDAGEPLARGAVTLVPRCPDEAREFCQKICTG